MPALVAGIHVLPSRNASRSSWPGRRPAMMMKVSLGSASRCEDVEPLCLASDRSCVHLSRCNPRLAVNLICAFFKGRRKAREGRVKHRSHQGRENSAFEFICDEETDVADVFALRFEGPAVYEV